MVVPLSQADRRLLTVLEPGLDFTSRPYQALAEKAGMSEEEVLARLRSLQGCGTISRFGAIVRHRALGYRANAMVVWDVADDRVRDAGTALAVLPFVTLCYRRPRRPPLWPYNLFCMIHGRDRDAVRREVQEAAVLCGLSDVPRDVLFSRRAFKQQGARYGAAGPTLEERKGAA